MTTSASRPSGDSKQDVMDMLNELSQLTKLGDGDPQAFRIRAAYESAAQSIVCELIRQRLAWRPADAREVLETAAVLGHEFLPARVAEAMGADVATSSSSTLRGRSSRPWGIR